MNEREFLFCLALNRIFINSTRIFLTLLKHFGEAGKIFESTNDPDLDRRLKSFDGWDLCERELKKIKELGCELCVFGRDNYPEALCKIDLPPPILTVRQSDSSWLDLPAVAIVGSRKASPHGLEVAFQLAYDLAKQGVTIVSGLAYGIDSAAHKGAVEADGSTVAVLGTGMDVIYPRSNLNLSDSIPKRGAILTEFPMGTLPNGFNFPRRNRIISALSSLVVIVEATYKSGSLITARYALEQGREVGSVPGPANSAHCAGSNNLLRSGAHLIENVDDVLGLISMKRAGQSLQLPVRSSGQDCLENHQTVFSLDELVENSGLSVDVVRAAVGLMVLDGNLEELPGTRYRWRGKR